DGSDRDLRLFGVAVFDQSLYVAPNMRPVLRLDGGGAQATLAGLDRLGESLSLSIWVYPTEALEHTVLVDHGTDSVALELVGNPARMRFSLHGHAFDSMATVKVEDWSHLAVLYDGRRVRLFVNGRLDTTASALLGGVPRGSARDLGIGARAPG